MLYKHPYMVIDGLHSKSYLTDYCKITVKSVYQDASCQNKKYCSAKITLMYKKYALICYIRIVLWCIFMMKKGTFRGTVLSILIGRVLINGLHCKYFWIFRDYESKLPVKHNNMSNFFRKIMRGL